MNEYRTALIVGIIVVMAATVYGIYYYSDLSHYECRLTSEGHTCMGHLVCDTDTLQPYWLNTSYAVHEIL